MSRETATTSYGTWCNRVEQYSSSVAHSVAESFGSGDADGYDVSGIERDYRAAVNGALPERVSLCGDEFIGPAYPAPGEFAEYPTDEYDRLDIRAIVNAIDYLAIVAMNETKNGS